VVALSIFAALMASAARANLVVNGSFESTVSGTTIYNMSNGFASGEVTALTAFGGADEIDLMENSTNIYGSPAVDGVMKLGIHNQLATSGPRDEFTLALTAPLSAGTYTLSFYAQSVTDFDPDLGNVEVGLSGTSSALGTLVYTTPTLSTAWTQYTTTVTAVGGESYLSMAVAYSGETWAHIDDIQLELVPEPATFVAMGASLAALAAHRRRR
jgi:hypothetical protein